VLLIHPELPLRRERLQTGWKTLVWRKSFGGVRKFDQQLVRRIQADESICGDALPSQISNSGRYRPIRYYNDG
jgi:hypothetical protein